METETAFDNIEIAPPAGNGEYENLPPNAYIAKCIGFKEVERPEWKKRGDLKNHPDREPDALVWKWTFEVIEGEWAGKQVWTYENRSWHERSNSGKYAAALLGKDKLDGSEGGSGVLAGKVGQLWINDKGFITNVTKRPASRGKAPAKAAEPRENLLARKAAALRARKEDGWTNAELQDEYHKNWKDAAFADLPQEEQVAVCEYFENLGPAAEIEF